MSFHIDLPLKYAIAATVAALFPLNSIAQDEMVNGQKLLVSCQAAVDYLDNEQRDSNLEAVKFCDDYLTGFREDENVKDIYMPGRYYRNYCFPYSGITNAELARVLVSFLKNNENELNLAANTAIRDAFVDGYPCDN